MEAVRGAIEALEPPVELRRLRMRRAAGRHFADVVIGVPPAAAVEQGHAAADAVEEAVEEAVPGTDVVVHVEPPRPRPRSASGRTPRRSRVPRVREIHNVTVLRVGERTEISLHLKLPGGLPLGEAHEIASQVEAAIREELPEVDGRADPPRAARRGDGGEGASDARARRPSASVVERIVRAVTGRAAA